ncbi:MAG: family 78 glycoside hydrolase catalytic domain [Clostridia bacterium]|nr:family 78 glycoside hydrolase catalytic domain [Clostridia bacterium]
MKKNEMFGSALFVKPSAECVAPCFRGVFEAKQGTKTEITVCGLGVFRLYVNGRKVSDDIFAPVTSFYHEYDSCANYVKYGEKMNSRIYCMKYDITELIADGKNSVCAVVGPSWYSVYSNCCIFCYKIESGTDVFYSDTSVKWSDSPLTWYFFARGEKQDYTKHSYDGKWLNAEFDDSEWQNTVEAFIPETEYYIQDCPNDKIIRSIECKKILEAENYDVYDAGENITGWYVFKCPEKGRKITVTVSEELDESGDLHEKWVHGQTAEYICDGSDREYHLLFTWQAFRYLRIDKGAELLRIDVIHTGLPVSSDFKCENAVLNGIYNNYIRTQLCNMHMGIPSDCPHLERRGYTGDGQLACEAAMVSIESRKFYLKWMEDIADCQDEISGHVQYTAPYIESGGGPGGWGCAIAEVPYVFYKMYGDSEPFRKYFDKMLHYFDYLEAHSENELVISDQPNQWCLGDWCSPHEKHGMKPEIPEPFVNNYFYVRTIDRMLEMLDVIGRADEKENLLAIRKRKTDALVKNYFNAETGDFADNLNSANAFALDIGLGDERTLKSLVNAVKTKPLDTGIFGTELVPKVLFSNGYFDEAVNFLAQEEYPSFGYMFKCGATTLWEEWKDPRSMSHPMFGSVVKFLFYYILGIRRAEGDAGFRKIVIEPKINAITGSVSGFITTEKGRVSVAVDSMENICTVTVPNGIEAEIIFDGKIVRK